MRDFEIFGLSISNAKFNSNSICSNSAKSTFLTAKKRTIDLEETDVFNLKKRVELIFRY